MAWVHLLVDGVEPLQASFPNKSLKAMTEDNIGRFAKISQCLSLADMSKFDAAIQMEGNAI